MLNSIGKFNRPFKFVIVAINLSLFLSIANSSNMTIDISSNITDDAKKGLQFPSFQQYVRIYHKPYVKGSDEYAKRKEIYEKRIEKLEKMQADPEIDYEVGVNRFSDTTDEQRNSRKPLQVDETSRKVYMQQPQKLNQASGAPSSLDWRQRGVVTSVKDQGQCGSCWTFATAAYGQSRLVMRNQSSLNIDLSQQYLLSCTPECTCQGGYLQYVFQKAAGGVPLQSDYPYSPYLPTSPFICWTSKKIYFGYIPKKMYDLSDSQMISLLQNGPVAIGISGTNWEDYKGGVFKCNRRDKVNHAVLLVGYTPDYWIVKNQWGNDWGEAGFIRVSRNPLNNCGVGVSAFVMWQSIQTFLALLLLFVLISIN